MSFEGEEEEDYEANFQFFLELAKPLVIELPSSEDRALAAAWVTRLEAEPETDEEKSLRVDYLKLLLFVMQRGRLIAPFKNEPPEEALQPFPEGFGLAEMGNLLLEQAELQGSGDGKAASVPFSVEISNDLKEFVAAQEIPHFGVQVYYAWSMEEPIHKWSSFDENNFPQYVRDKIKQLKVINSEEKTNVQCNAPGDGSARKSCDSSLYDRKKAKVKSPQEIEKSLERNTHEYSSPSLEGSPKEEDKGWPCGKKSRSKKSSPSGIPRKTEMNVARLCGSEFHDSEDGGCNSAGGVRDRLKDRSGGCGCSVHHRKQEPESSKRLQKCDAGEENGRTFVNDMAGPGQRNSERYGEDIFSDNRRCGVVKKEKPICPAARLYLMNQAPLVPLIKSPKTKCPTQVSANVQQEAPQDTSWQQNRPPGQKNYSEDPGKKCNYTKPSLGKSCNSSSSSRPPCPCTCPREEKEPRESSCPKKKVPAEKTCSKVSKSPFSEPHPRRSMPLDEMDDGRPCNMKTPFQMPLEGMNHMEGCTCLEGTPPAKHLEGLSRIGLGKTTPMSCINVIKQQQQQQHASGKKKACERQEKRQQTPFQPCQPPASQQEEAMPAPCLKPRPRIVGEQLCEANKKANSCPGPRNKLTAMADACYAEMTKPGTEDNRLPSRPMQSEYGPTSCGAKNEEIDTGTRTQQPFGERNFQGKGHETEVKHLQHTPRQQQQQQECGIDGAGKDDKRAGFIQAALEEMISPCTPREFIDDLSSSSAEEPCPDGDTDGQDEAAGGRNAGKYECAVEDNDEDDGAGVGGYSSSSDNVGNGGAGQTFDDYEPNVCQKAPPRRRPVSLEPQGGSHMPMRPPGQPYSLPPNYNQTGQQYPPNFGGENATYSLPYNHPNFNPHPFSMPFGGGLILGQTPFNSPQAIYNPTSPGPFPIAYGAVNQSPASYNPPQTTYSQVAPRQPYSLPCGGGNQPTPNLFGQPQTNYGQPPSGTFIQSGVCAAPSRQRQTTDARSTDGSRRGMSTEQRDFSQSYSDQREMPLTSTPYNTSSPPPPPRFLLSPITDTSEQWMRVGGGMFSQRSEGTNEGPVRCDMDTMDQSRNWVTLRGFNRSSMEKSCNRTPDQSSEIKRQPEPNMSMQSEMNSSLSCQYGSSPEESPKWRELPKSTRFQRNLTDRSCYK